jgi:hypothetical protein
MTNPPLAASQCRRRITEYCQLKTKNAMSASSLKTRLQAVRRRWWAIGIVAGLAWALVAAILLVLIGGWLDLLWELPPVGRISVLGASVLAGFIFFLCWLMRVGWEGRFTILARRIDRAMGFGGEVLTGWELERTLVQADHSAHIKRGEMRFDMASMAVEHAAKQAGKAPLGKAAPTKPAHRPAFVLASLLVAVAVLALIMPNLARTQWKRFLSPYSDVPPFSKTTIEIEDPEKDVPYGDSIKILATTRGEPVDAAELVMEYESGQVETLPMFPKPDSQWEANVAKVTSPAIYYVRAYRARSEKHNIRVKTVPRIENVRFRIIPPAYTNRPAYEGPLPKEGVAGLPGAKVLVWATSNRPLSGGTISVAMRSNKSNFPLGEGERVRAEGQGSHPNPLPKGEGAVSKIPMKPTAAGSSEVLGEFAVTGDGKFELDVVDVNNRDSQQSFSGGITLLNDERPMIRIVQPPATSLATPEAVLPVALSAEDDYGISRVELFRSLNDSRPLPVQVPLPKRPPRRLNEKVDLPLAAYGLKPGDIIKLFGRVEDNDPAGAKGSESSVVTVEIISQEEFERMARVRSGMDIMLSRYREAQRRLEVAAEETDRLRKKTEKQKPGDAVSAETKSELKQLVKRMKDEAAAIKKLGMHKLPYGMDKTLSSEMGKAAKLPEEAAEALEKMLKDADLHNEALARQLGKIGKQLGQERQAFDEAAMKPMELLAAILPLMADQERFKMLVMHQQDLVERLSSLKGRDKEDNPALKARMRELEEEQRAVRESLDALLSDIEDHLKKLPDDEHLMKLRVTATKFVEEVRESGAATAMSEAEAGLAEYSGTIGHEKAKEAADILEKFVKKCNGMGQSAGECLSDPVFQPMMGNCMKQTLAQLLAEMGFGGGGSGMGGFLGSGSGSGAQRGFGPNVGLYGGFPGMDQPFETGFGQGPQDEQGKGGTIGGSNPDLNSSYETSAEGTLSGAGDGAIPFRYRRPVGKYFERLAEEIQEK